MSFAHTFNESPEEHRRRHFWRTAPADPIALAKKADVAHFNTALGRALMPQSAMPIGEHAGKIMSEVPTGYLAWVNAQPWSRHWPAWAPVTDYLTRYPTTPADLETPAAILFVSPLFATVPTDTWRWDQGAQLTALRGHEDKVHAFAIGHLQLRRQWAVQPPGEPLHYLLSPKRRWDAIQHGVFELQPGLKQRQQHFHRLRESGQTQCTKHCYPTKQDADLTAKARMTTGPRQHRPAYLRSYECQRCGFWHLTKQPLQ